MVKRFKRSKVKNKIKKRRKLGRIRSEQDLKKRKKKFRKRRSILLSDLKQWEEDQIQQAVREHLRRKKQGRPPVIEEYYKKHDSLYQQKCFSIQDMQDLSQFDFKHLLDAAGMVQYWGQLPQSFRPKPKLLPNGDLSLEDMVLNPQNPSKHLRGYPRVLQRAKVLKQILVEFAKHHPQLNVKREIRVDEPKKIDSFILDSKIKLDVEVDPEQITKHKSWGMSDAVYGYRRFYTRKQCIHAALHSEKPIFHALLTYDCPGSEKYWLKEYELIIREKNGKRKYKLILQKKTKKGNWV